MSKSVFGTVAVVAMSLVSPQAFAQETPRLYDLACVHSKIEVPEGLRCQTTQNYSGFRNSADGDGNGTFRNWVARGTIDGVQYLYLMTEVTSMNVGLNPSISLQDTIRAEVTPASRPANFSALTHRSGADFMTFTLGNGSACVGVRRYGPSETVGYRWILNAVRCAPPGTALSAADVDSYIVGVRLRRS